MIYIGIDPSLTGTGIVVLDGDGNVRDKDLIVTTPRHKIEDRLHSIVESILGTLNLNAEMFVCIEGLSFGAKGNSMMELAGLHYLLRYFLVHQLGLIPSIVPPTTLKKWVCGTGTAKKEQMLLQTYKRWGIEFADNNICDAYCLARYAMAL